MMGVAAMRTYLVRVPGSAYSSLSDEELAAVANWILEEFNAETLPADFVPLSTTEVTRCAAGVIVGPSALSHRTLARLRAIERAVSCGLD